MAATVAVSPRLRPSDVVFDVHLAFGVTICGAMIVAAVEGETIRMAFAIDIDVLDRPVTIFHHTVAGILSRSATDDAAHPVEHWNEGNGAWTTADANAAMTIADAAGRRWLVRLASADAPAAASSVERASPRASVRNATVSEGDPRSGTSAKGYFSTDGNRIVDALGRPVRLAGVNWFGAESTTFAPHGLWARGYKEMMDQIAGLGFNTLRLPISDELLEAGSEPNGIDFSKNADLAGLSGLEILDRIIAYAGEIGLRVILDHHRSSAGTGVSDNGLWYDDRFPEAKWISNWQRLARRYAGDPTVIGADLHNEPHNGRWGGGGATDWPAAAERAGNAILAVNRNWLIFVEGVEDDGGKSYWWGGNLKGVSRRPVKLDVPHKLVYSAHDYPNSIYAQTWFSDPRYPKNLPAKFTEFWGYIHRQKIAPVLIGEFGSRLEDPKDLGWFETITAYLDGDFDADGDRELPASDLGFHWTWWSWNPNSGDTGGILDDDWTTVLTEKVEGLEPLMFDWRDAGGSSGRTPARFVVTLSRPAEEAVTVRYRTVHGTTSASDLILRRGTLTFRAGESRKVVEVPVLGDDAREGDERFRLELTGAKGARLGRRSAVGTIRDDD